MFSSQDIILLGIIVVVLFGASKLPQLGKGLGQAIGNFKKALNEPEEIEAPQKGENSQKEEAVDKEN
jgi:sec-independent protein translocase protein TatA